MVLVVRTLKCLHDSVEQNIRNMQVSSIFTIISACLAVGTASDSVVGGGGGGGATPLAGS